jgi:hypothetical protein
MSFDQLFCHIRLRTAAVFGREPILRFVHWLWVSTLFLGLSAYPLRAQQDSSELAELKYKLQAAESPVQKAQTLLELFEQYKRRDLNKASLYNDQVLAMIPDQIKQKELWARAYINKAIQLFINYEQEKAINYSMKAIITVPVANYPLLHAEAYNVLAVINQDLGNLSKTFEYAYRALALSNDQTLEGAKLRLLTRYNLALNYINLRQYKEAEYLIKQNTKEPGYHKIPGRQAQDLNLLAQIAQRKGQYNLVIRYALESIKQRVNIGPIQDDINAYIMLHVANVELKKDQKSLAYLNRAKILTDSIQDVISDSNIMDLYANHYLRHRQLDSALILAERGIAIARQNDLLHFHLSLLSTHAHILKKMGKNREALRALREYHMLEEKIKSEGLKQSTQQQFANYQLGTRQEKINQRYLKKIEVEKQKRSLGITVFVFALIIGGVTVLLYRHRLRNHRILLQKQQLIAEQAEALQNLNEQKTQLFGVIAGQLSKHMVELRQLVNKLKPGIPPIEEQKILDELREHSILAKSALTEVLSNTRTMIGEENYFEG